jgi:hypothetical protein
MSGWIVQKYLELTLSTFTTTNETRVRAWSLYVNTDTILIQKTDYFNVIGALLKLIILIKHVRNRLDHSVVWECSIVCSKKVRVSTNRLFCVYLGSTCWATLVVLATWPVGYGVVYYKLHCPLKIYYDIKTRICFITIMNIGFHET